MWAADFMCNYWTRRYVVLFEILESFILNVHFDLSITCINRKFYEWHVVDVYFI